MVMPVITVTEPRKRSDIEKWSLPDIISNEQGILAGGQSVDFGTPLGINASTGYLEAWSPGAIPATAVFTETSSNNFIANDTVQVGNFTYKFVSAIGSTAGNVLLGANFAASAANLLNAINNGFGEGTTYISASVTPNVTAAFNGTNAITFTATAAGTAGNSLASVYTAAGTAAGAFGGATFSGGVAGDTDGSQQLVGFALAAIVTASGVTANLPYKARYAALSSTGILWPAGTTAAQIAAALAQVLQNGIVVRPGE